MREGLEFLMEAGSVERNHTHPGLLSDSVARHSWGVAMLCHIICEASCMMASYDLIMAALTHDLGEVASSDVNGAAKNQLYSAQANAERDYIEEMTRARFGLSFNAPYNGQHRVLEFADKIEYLLRCVRERCHGNITATRGFRQTREIVYTMLEEIEFFDKHKRLQATLHAVMHAVTEMWKEANIGIATEFDVYGAVAEAIRSNHVCLPTKTPDKQNVSEPRTEQPK